MPGPNTPLNSPDDSTCLHSSAPDAISEKREVQPLFLSSEESEHAPEHTPPGLSNPFWNH